MRKEKAREGMYKEQQILGNLRKIKGTKCHLKGV